jgi:dipeptidase D
MDLNRLEPRAVWARFFDICAIPHPSRHEEALAAWLVGWAKARGLEASRDKTNNVVIRKAASRGHEGARGLILQAHIDMVPQKASGSSHDFEADPIVPRLAPEAPAWLVATGTTLGADDGVGVAMALAILEDPELIHGPLECLFTTNEEDGMSGARAVEPDALGGSLLLNLDGEDDGEITIGCAGSIRTGAELSAPALAVPSDWRAFEASVGGLLGGHSGADIDKGRANASLALVRLLGRAGLPLRLASIEGGTAANAIPREARAVVAVRSESAGAFRLAFEREAAALRAELAPADPDFAAALSPYESPNALFALDEERSASVLAVLSGLPNGLQAMEPDMPGLVRTSLNLGRLSSRVEAGVMTLSTLVMVRSSSDEEKEALARAVESRLDGAAETGWRVLRERPAAGPAWAPNPESAFLAMAKDCYGEVFGKAPKVASTHGGLECALFKPRFPGWDMISVGPRILAPHSPDERIEIASVGRSYRFVKELVGALS